MHRKSSKFQKRNQSQVIQIETEIGGISGIVSGREITENMTEIKTETGTGFVIAMIAVKKIAMTVINTTEEVF